MTKLEKVVQLMSIDSSKSTIFIKCTDVDRFIKIVDIVEKQNQHKDDDEYLKEVFCFNNNNNTMFIQASKNVATQLIDIKFFDSHYGNKTVDDIDFLKELDDLYDSDKLNENKK